MKKIRTFFAIAFAVVLSNAFVISALAQLDRHPTRAVDLSWNPVSLQWDSTWSMLYEYDSFKRVTSKTAQMFAGGSFVNSNRTVFTYNDNGGILEEIRQRYENGAWINYSRDKKEYDSDNIIRSETRYIWNGSEWTIETDEKYINQKNEKQQITEVIIMVYYDGKWQNQRRTTYTYDNKNNATSFTIDSWEDDSWQPDIRFINISYRSDSNNLLDEDDVTGTTYQRYNAGTWIDVSKDTSVFLAPGRPLSDITLTWVSTLNEWVLTNRSTHGYDKNQNRTFSKYETYDLEDKSWRYSSERVAYEYNADNTVKSAELEALYDFSEEWKKTRKFVYSYAQPTGIAQYFTLSDIVKVFPNPAAENLVIENAKGEITLYNSLGEKVWSGDASNIKINTSQFPSGQYILRIESKKGIQSQKIVIAR